MQLFFFFLLSSVLIFVKWNRLWGCAWICIRVRVSDIYLKDIQNFVYKTAFFEIYFELPWRADFLSMSYFFQNLLFNTIENVPVIGIPPLFYVSPNVLRIQIQLYISIGIYKGWQKHSSKVGEMKFYQFSESSIFLSKQTRRHNSGRICSYNLVWKLQQSSCQARKNRQVALTFQWSIRCRVSDSDSRYTNDYKLFCRVTCERFERE